MLTLQCSADLLCSFTEGLETQLLEHPKGFQREHSMSADCTPALRCLCSEGSLSKALRDKSAQFQTFESAETFER